MSGSDFGRGFEIGAGGEWISQLAPRIPLLASGRSQTYPRFSWYSVRSFMNSSRSSDGARDIPRLGAMPGSCRKGDGRTQQGSILSHQDFLESRRLEECVQRAGLRERAVLEWLDLAMDFLVAGFEGPASVQQKRVVSLRNWHPRACMCSRARAMRLIPAMEIWFWPQASMAYDLRDLRLRVLLIFFVYYDIHARLNLSSVYLR